MKGLGVRMIWLLLIMLPLFGCGRTVVVQPIMTLPVYAHVTWVNRLALPACRFRVSWDTDRAVHMLDFKQDNCDVVVGDKFRIHVNGRYLVLGEKVK